MRVARPAELLDDLGALEDGFRAAAAGVLRHPLPAYAFTTSALDASLAPPGQHTVYLASPLGPLRPVPALRSHRTPVEGLYVTGAGTAPAGGISGAPGRGAARAVLADARGA